jgi:hypothetical protein
MLALCHCSSSLTILDGRCARCAGAGGDQGTALEPSQGVAPLASPLCASWEQSRRRCRRRPGHSSGTQPGELAVLLHLLLCLTHEDGKTTRGLTLFDEGYACNAGAGGDQGTALEPSQGVAPLASPLCASWGTKPEAAQRAYPSIEDGQYWQLLQKERALSQKYALTKCSSIR